jgi:transposase-like protein
VATEFPAEIIQQAIWLYLCFTLSLRDVEDLLAERGITVAYESIRRWVIHFGPMIAANLRKHRPKPHTSWHLDEIYLKIDGCMVYLWRAVDAEGEVLDVLVQSKRDRRAALKLMRKLLKTFGFVPDRLITDDLRSYGAAARDLGIEKHHGRGRWKKQSRRELAPANPTTRTQDARLQEPRIRPTISLNPCRRLPHLRRPASPGFSIDAPQLPRRGRWTPGAQRRLEGSRHAGFLRSSFSNVTMPPDCLPDDLGWEPVATVADSLHPVGYRANRRTATSWAT